MDLRKEKPKLDSKELLEYAIKALGRRSQSSSELRSKLRLKAAAASDIEPVIERLREYRYLDDSRFAENFAVSRRENEGFGRSRTLRELRNRRVSGSTAEAAVESVYREVDEIAQIESFIRRKFRNEPRDTLFQQDRDLAAAYRRLLRAGFRSSNVVRVLKRFAKNPELLDAIEPNEGEGPANDET